MAPLALAASAVQAGRLPAAPGRPLIRSYGSAELHSKGAVLSFAETNDSCLFVGSNQLVVFDGLGWQVLDIPGAYAFRALAAGPSPGRDSARGGRVWIGAVGAIGYARRDPRGVWTFVSLLPQARASGVSDPGEIWFADAMGSGALFATTHGVLRWDGRRFEHWEFPAGRRIKAAADGDGNSVLFVQAGTGLFRVAERGAPALARPASALPSAPVEWLLPCRGGTPADGSGMLLGTAEGAYRLVPGGYRRLDALAGPVSRREAILATGVDETRFALGTLKGGVILADRAGREEAVVDRAGGLADDAVYSLWSDRRGGLWVGLDDGCARLDRVGSVSVLSERDGLKRGLPRKVVAQGGTTYVLTDKAFYRVADSPDSSAPLEPVIPSDPRLCDAVADSKGVWIGAADGLWRVEAGRVFHEFPATGSVACLATPPWLHGGVLYTEDYSLKALSASPSGSWKSWDLGLRTADAPNSLVVDPSGEVWLAASSDGIYRLRPKEAPVGPPGAPALVAHYLPGRGLPPTARHLSLWKLGSRLLAFTDGEILEFDRGRGFVPAPGLEGWIGIAGAVVPGPAAPTEGTPAAYLLARRAEFGADDAPLCVLFLRPARASRGPLEWRPARVPGIDGIGDGLCLDIVEGPTGPSAWLGGEGGLLRFAADKPIAVDNPRPLALRRVIGGAPLPPGAPRSDEVAAGGIPEPGRLALAPSETLEIGPGSPRIEFGFSAAQPMEPAPAGVFYQTRLAGIETDWTAPDRKTSREFTGLAPGRYSFMVRRIDRYGRAGAAFAYPFAVLAPWYLRGPALGAYLAAFGLAGAGLFRWRVRRLRRQNERLDRLVAERTRELELSNTAKSEFLENISHEIRNPLNGLAGAAGLIKPDGLDPEQRELALSLKARSEELRRISEDVLEFSKWEFGYGAVAEAPFSMRGVLDDVARTHREGAARSGNTLSSAAPDGPDGFLGDAAKIRTIVGNFVGNAIKYAPGAPIEIRAEWTAGADSGETPDGRTSVYLSVTDAGPGIPPEEQELIFRKFVRGSKAKAGGALGAGLGLAMCRAFAQRMGGSVGVESPVAAPPGGRRGPGSTFHVWLPLKRSPSPPAAGQPDRAPAAAGVGDSSPNRPRLGETRPSPAALIVDDEDYNRTVLAAMAKELGFSAVQASDARSAIELAARRSFDVVFLDLELPDSKGDEAARRLREIPGRQEAILIATTGHDSDEARRRCSAAGIDGFLLKPFDTGQVERLVAEIRAARAPAGTRTALPRLARPPPEPFPAVRAFELYAQGTGLSTEAAAARFVEALKQECSAIARAAAEGDRGPVGAAAHRLRTLGALAGSAAVNRAAALLQDAAGLGDTERLRRLSAEAIAETERLERSLLGRDVRTSCPPSA